MRSRLGDVEHCHKVGRLSAGGEHSHHTAFEGRDFGRRRVAGGVLQTRVEVARFGEVEETGHLFAAVVFEGRGLVDGELS